MTIEQPRNKNGHSIFLHITTEANIMGIIAKKNIIENGESLMIYRSIPFIEIDSICIHKKSWNIPVMVKVRV
jgi:hypothetical protein